ncbi:MAG: 3-deoxy-manno-octulosonate cytidylyltransferase [Endomicrobium sp.]|jgi:3-deoxy-manno-octulosonate cytidylyltransferase (CMP-KDO synthetase)|uniref:3-deoxy-manno-octulosonate cytidylyltransferase n=1 Tax=Candidatus Endomicrobiellum cubanum TaxID=3242325 RepID=UPI002835DAA1|nr:3-deoxy-manno-octulosonate cytidylyltransferase [Endomicrobium sp.]
MKTAVVIPSRYGSSRFPGKPLALIGNKFLIQHSLERVKMCKEVDFIAVATDDKRIFNAVENLGFNVFMTPKTCQSGTDRIAFLAKKSLSRYDVFINVQGDEPLIDPALIDELVKSFKKDKALEYVTAAFKMKNAESINNPNVVKVVFDKKGYALYFSRSPIPYNRDNIKTNYYKHIGIYGYKRNFLLEFSKNKKTILENTENLEQLRALESGKKIKVVIAKSDSVGVDTPEDILKVERCL